MLFSSLLIVASGCVSVEQRKTYFEQSVKQIDEVKEKTPIFSEQLTFLCLGVKEGVATIFSNCTGNNPIEIYADGIYIYEMDSNNKFYILKKIDFNEIRRIEEGRSANFSYVISIQYKNYTYDSLQFDLLSKGKNAQRFLDIVSEKSGVPISK